ncbi:MAG: PAS domain-containing protein [Bacteroidota bacterium]|nr:PAS domain-containing protein [Bacteroidota bacterium]
MEITTFSLMLLPYSLEYPHSAPIQCQPLPGIVFLYFKVYLFFCPGIIDNFLLINTTFSPFRQMEGQWQKNGVKFSYKDYMGNQRKADEAELKYAELQHSSLVGIIVFNTEFLIQETNPTASKILKRKSQDLKGKHFKDYLHQQYKNSFDSYLERIRKTKKRQDHAFQLRNEEGEDIYIMLESIPFLDEGNEIESIHSIIIDFTAQHLSNLKNQTKLIQLAVENMLDPFIILTAVRDDSDKIIDFIYTYVNKEAEKANKLKREDTIGKKLLDIFPTFRNGNMFNEFVKVAETGRPVIKEGVYMEFANKHQTIKGIFHTRINKLDNGIIVTYRDITENKNAEEKINSMMIELARSNRELDQFTHIVSHDLQEPLRVVSQFTRLLVEKNKGKLTPQSEEYASFILDGITRMNLLLVDLLKYARLTSMAKPFELTDLNKVVSDVLNDLTLQINDNKTEITVDPLPTIMAVPIQMRQLFQNLIGNAIKFKSETNSRIKVSAQKGTMNGVFR